MNKRKANVAAQILTTEEVAQRIGISGRRVRAIAESRSIMPLKSTPRFAVWWLHDLEKFKPGPSGRPRGG